jgi:hypothetical protein
MKRLCLVFALAVTAGGALREWEHSPEYEDGFKHRVHHALGIQPSILQHYVNREGQAVIGMRCIVCARVDGDDEHEAHIEPLAEARVRMMQKNWLLMRRGRVEDVKDFDCFVESCLRQDRRVHDE